MHMDTDNGSCGSYERQFSDRLRFLRNRKRISAREMSIALGQNVNYVNLIENGKRTPSLRGFFSICDCLGCAPQDFFGGGTEADGAEERGAPEDVQREISAAVRQLTEEQSRAVLRMLRSFLGAQ